MPGEAKSDWIFEVSPQQGIDAIIRIASEERAQQFVVQTAGIAATANTTANAKIAKRLTSD